MNLSQLTRIDLNLLVVFAAVLEERQVTRTAAKLNLTPSAISHALIRLRRIFNDPLFLKTPKGVTPTARALELAEPVIEILARVESVVSTAAPFDPMTSERRFVIGAPDAVIASVIGPFVDRVSKLAPNIDFGFVHLMPSGPADSPWLNCLEQLSGRHIDLALLPLSNVPKRFQAWRLFDEDFVVAMRRGNAFARAPTLKAYCARPHLLVSLGGEPRGFVDVMLAKRGLERRVALTVPTFMMALSRLAKSDLIATLPRRLVEQYGTGFGLTFAELPLKRKPDVISLIATKAALSDSGVAWVAEKLKKWDK